MLACDDLLQPRRLWSIAEILARPSLVPKPPGVYAWYFRELDSLIPTADCLAAGDFRLLYIGISPSAPPSNGKLPSKQSLNHRLRYHIRGNAEGSTLRLSLGCILSERLGIELRRVGSGTRMTFATGEQRLSEWLEDNARVAWLQCDQPWTLEAQLIASINLPLNLEQNSRLLVSLRALATAPGCKGPCQGVADSGEPHPPQLMSHYCACFMKAAMGS